MYVDVERLYATELVQVKLPTLFKGRFVLVGDAGYAPGPTGTGTTLAMVGAYLLAGEVCKHKWNLDAALRGYETQLRPLINDLQKIPPLIPTLLAPRQPGGYGCETEFLLLFVGPGFSKLCTGSSVVHLRGVMSFLSWIMSGLLKVFKDSKI
ncbi:uncharacterized protein N7484_009396 [Penicillium longicatenatum]|uniref:uncharacterized protein n=1 Tax=Penicillium longicatenatum TaxID=1561947 RepID=UPI002546B549|nr:uncharacterized protein N7484_009396 [Penicillium longicatenatum]KAJ5636083.1 hypothetical protein N7484_009396 [Penicillium longicatenatum]